MRKMNDLGAFAVLGVAPLLARIIRTDDETYAEAVGDIRRSARERPAEADSLPEANVTRAVAWVLLTLLALPFLIIPSAARKSASPGVATLLEAVMTIAITVMLFAGAMVLLSGLRYSFAKFFQGDLRRRLDDHPDPKLGLLGAVSFPTIVDVIPALLFLACFAPLAYP